MGTTASIKCLWLKDRQGRVECVYVFHHRVFHVYYKVMCIHVMLLKSHNYVAMVIRGWLCE